MPSEEILYSIALRHCPLVGDLVFRKLVREAGSAKEVWQLSCSGLQSITGIGKKIAEHIGAQEHLDFAQRELEFCEKNNITVLLRHLDELPPLLQQCEDAPAVLYRKGVPAPQEKQPISIVGTRKLSDYGKVFIDQLLDELKHYPVVTISGLALGADSEVHRRSVQNDIPTTAVLAHGFHTLYPAANRRLAREILEKGGTLYTEFNSSQKPDRENFIQRNRIIAGMAPATIVVETAFGGGSVSTATFANVYNREVFALPGRIDETYSQGCNHLIYKNKAAAISTISALIEDLDLSGTKDAMEELFPASEIKILLSPDLQQILDHLDKKTPVSLDDIAERLDLPAYRILPDLLNLEMSGHVKALSGRQYLRVH